jgi:endonuclease YncB( thermonuclease family)
VVADIYAENGAKIAETLVSQGLAYRYDGGARRSWCSDDTDPS